MSIASQIKTDLVALADKEKGEFLKKYFKTGKGEYGEGDTFIGITVPNQRMVAKRYYKEATLNDVAVLLKSRVHEHRFTALEVLVFKFAKADEKDRKVIYQFYLKHRAYINNWDLVDTSARHIVGQYLFDKDRVPLYTLAKSKIIWDRRIAIIATHYFIYKDDYVDTLKLAEILMTDKHDLMHKAVGWMLREVGNRSKEILVAFLEKNATQMPRTTLRYAIERFSPIERKYYLEKKSR